MPSAALTTGRVPKWVLQSAAWRAELGVARSFHPFSGRLNCRAAGFGREAPKRVLDLLDCCVVQACKKRKVSVSTIRKDVAELVVDVSQSHARRPMPALTGPNRCLTTGARLFSFAKNRLLCGFEHLLLQGYSESLIVPNNVSENELRVLAGEAIALPCLGTLIWALTLTGKFPPL